MSYRLVSTTHCIIMSVPFAIVLMSSRIGILYYIIPIVN